MTQFDVQEYRALLELLHKHPEWRAELRQLLLSEELLTLPGLVRELVEAQRQTELRVKELAELQKRHEERLAGVEERLSHLEAAVAELAEVSKRHEERLARVEDRLSRLEATVAELIEIVRRHEERLASVEDRLSRLEATVAELIEIVRRHEERLASVEERLASVEERLASVEDRLSRLEATVAELAEAQKRSEERLTRLEKVVLELTEAQSRTERQVQRLVDRLGHISGDLLEIKYRDKPTAYFGRIVRQAQLVDLADVEGLVQEHLSEEEVIDLLQIDLVVRGRLRKPLWKEREAPEVWLAVEVSSVVDREDLERAYRRAQLLRRAGLLVLPVAAGQSSTLGAQAVAKAKGIVLQADGWFECLDEALERLKEG